MTIVVSYAKTLFAVAVATLLNPCHLRKVPVHGKWNDDWSQELRGVAVVKGTAFKIFLRRLTSRKIESLVATERKIQVSITVPGHCLGASVIHCAAIH